MNATMNQEQQGLRIERSIDIKATTRAAWDAMLEEIGPGMTGEKGEPMKMKLEAKPGGRYFRDLGNDAGHLWGHVQVIKPPPHPTPLLEITGPLFMSFAAINHLRYKLSENGDSTRLTLIHTAFGDIPADHREGMTEGWGEMLESIKKAAEKR